jgi:hypothetical protein
MSKSRMRTVHVVIPDLFLPQEVAKDVCSGLNLPALETLLARAQSEWLPANTLEGWVCTAFDVPDGAIAAVTLRSDGVDPGAAYWMRADPVYLNLQRDQLILQADIRLSTEEAARLCASLNAHFADDGLRFFAPHPQRWYLRLETAPDFMTYPVAQVSGKGIRQKLPYGPDAGYWHGVFNEVQMLFFEHGVNVAREARGESPVNSVWLWGGGRAIGQLKQPYQQIWSGNDLIASFAQGAGVPHAALPDDIGVALKQADGKVLLFWDSLQRALQYSDLQAWRNSLQLFEQYCAAPLLSALRSGQIAHLTLDVLSSEGPNTRAGHFTLTRARQWRVWRRRRPLAHWMSAGRVSGDPRVT